MAASWGPTSYADRIPLVESVGPNRPQKPLPELVDLKLFGKTILVVNKQFKLFFGQSTWEVSQKDRAVASGKSEPVFCHMVCEACEDE